MTHPPKPITLTEKDRARFLTKVGLPDSKGCMAYMGKPDAKGYGQFTLWSSRRVVKAHLVEWTIRKGSFPPALEADHTCNNRLCVNSDHLEWVTHEENNRRIGLRAKFCRAGLHRWEDYPSANNQHRECRPCRLRRRRERYAELKANGLSPAQARMIE